MSYPSKVNPAVSSAITSAINSNNSAVVVPGDQSRSNAIITTTWANRATAIASIAALTPANGLVYVSNVGINGSLWHCDGVKLICSNPLTLFQSSIPIVLPPSGIIGNNGALTLGTAIQAAGDYYMYFPANAIAAGVAAGRYYVSMSSTTLGTIFNNTYTSGNPTVPASPTAFVTTGPGAYVQTTGADITLISQTVLGNIMGKYGSIHSGHWAQQNNTAGSKITRVTFGASSTYSAGIGSGTLTNMGLKADIFNNGDTGKQTCTPSNTGTGFGQTAQDFVRLTKDTTADVALEYVGQIAVATDWIILSKTQVTLVNSPG